MGTPSTRGKCICVRDLAALQFITMLTRLCRDLPDSSVPLKQLSEAFLGLAPPFSRHMLDCFCLKKKQNFLTVVLISLGQLQDNLFI